MDEKDVRNLLEDVVSGKISVEEGVEKLKILPMKRLEDVTFDTHRSLRRGLAEVVFAEGKSDTQLLSAAKIALETGENVIITRISIDQARFLIFRLDKYNLVHHPEARMVTVVQKPVQDMGMGEILIVSAGAADLQVAEEAAITCSILGNRVQRIYDVGVAGIHRILQHIDAIRNAAVIIVVAGLEGALPSVVAGLTQAPVIAVPTSTGYGAAFGGIAPLLAMLNSCSGGVSVVNIDNGFGAGLCATLINRRRANNEKEQLDIL